MRHGGDSFAPAARIARIDVPLLAMAGGDSPEWMADAARAIAAAARQGTYRQVDGFGHNVPAEAVAPILRTIFR
jgi:pimeloyl-ACP methyl ester carboxylesterase